MISSPLRSLHGMERRKSEFGVRLEQAIARRKTDRKALAKALGITVQAVGNAIRDGKFSAENTARASRYLHVNWFWLATGEEAMEVADQGLRISDEERGLLLKLAAPAPIREVPAGVHLLPEKPRPAGRMVSGAGNGLAEALRRAAEIERHEDEGREIPPKPTRHPPAKRPATKK